MPTVRSWGFTSRRRALVAALLSCLGLSTAACGGGGPRTETPAPPEPKAQFVEAAAPFIVDWDAPQIASLATAIRTPNGGAVIVAARGSVLRILPDCHVSAVYVPSGIGMYRGSLQVRRGDALGLKTGLKVEALQQVATSENVPQSTLVDYRFVVTGRYHLGASRKSAKLLELSERTGGGCRGATHFVSAALTGAFERLPDLNASTLAGVAQAQQKLPLRGGDFPRCMSAGTAADIACSAFVKIELTPISGARVELQLASFQLGGLSVSSLQFVFRGKNNYSAGTTPFTTATASPMWKLPPAEVGEDSPLVVEAIEKTPKGPQVLATGQITPSDVRKAVFDIVLRNPTGGGTVGSIHMVAAESAATAP